MPTRDDILNAYFAPYQKEWLADRSRIKIWKKSRRVGATYIQSFEDVADCLETPGLAVWFSSADETAAKEYILYVEMWLKIFDAVAENLGEIVIDKQNSVTALAVKISNGSRIHALTSNPRKFRSKGGKVVLDEFAHHEDQKAMWKAAYPSATWGYDIRIMSTHQGRGLFFNFVEACKKKKLDWSLHTTDIFTAVEQGLVDRIMGRPTTQREREAWLENERRNCFDEVIWLEEYCCQAQEEGDAFLSYELITKCEEDDLLWEQDIIPTFWNGKESGIIEPKNPKMLYIHEKIAQYDLWIKSLKPAGNLFVGFDVARRKDLIAMGIIEKIYHNNILRHLIIMENMPFWVQRGILFAMLSHPKMYRACIDETGIGMNIAEDAIDEFGEAKVEAINFASGNIRTEMAFGMKSEFEDRSILIPRMVELRDDLHSVKKYTTAANKIRLEAQNDDDNKKNTLLGHADRFWMLGLALHASNGVILAPVKIKSGGKRKSSQILKGYLR